MVEPSIENLSFKIGKFNLQVDKSLLFQSRITIPLKPSQIISIPCFSSENPIFPKYSFTLVDSPSKQKLKLKTFSVFIIPQGQENSWSFSEIEGQRDLLKTVNTSRLLFVKLNHGFEFSTMQAIQQELSEIAQFLAPPMGKSSRIAFMTNGDIGERAVVFQNGNMIIEDVKEEETYLRQLIYLTNVNQIQSEIKLKQVLNTDSPLHAENSPAVKQGGLLEADYSTLTCEWLKVMLFSLAFNSNTIFGNEEMINVLILGAGGGVFSSFLLSHFQNIQVFAVDIDSSLIDIGRRFFGAKESNRQQIIIEDALVFVENCRDLQFDLVFLDICAADSHIPTPPPPFTSQDFLRKLKNLMTENCVLSINTFGTAHQKENSIKEILKSFESLYKISCKEDTNDILFCLKKIITQSQIEDNLKIIEERKTWDSSLNLSDYLSALKLETPKSS
ncbi:unnamed protein product [Blepharisma stoltei]|uniref:Methyltransferase-like protein 13 n=1 Tax=Blepharisma stoltei TaxID=1481888 RepID=A0AAU9JSY7_9CILI|nr:unnamed protein product [Blepharisma stoltei]